MLTPVLACIRPPVVAPTVPPAARPLKQGPAACGAVPPELTDDAAAGHAGRQTTLLTHRRSDSPGGKWRVGTTRARLVARPGLESTGDGEYSAGEVVVAYVLTDSKHFDLKAGTYCLTARHHPERGPITDYRAWVTYLRGTTGDFEPVARLPFQYRVSHPAQPGVSARFEFLKRGELALLRSESVMPSVQTVSTDETWLMPGAWFRCGSGCCSGGFDVESFD